MSSEQTIIECPYVGLAPFEPAHAEYFFGRTLDSNVIADNVLARPITVLYGPSGVGKSSILNVGVPRALKDMGISACLAPRREWHEPQLLSDWLDGILAAARVTPDVPLILVLDQFEEYFLYPNATQNLEFMRQLRAMLMQKDVESHLLISLRDDGLHRLDALRVHLPSILDTTLELRHLDDEAVVEAIEKPIAIWNMTHKPGVVIDPDFALALIEDLRPRDKDGKPIEGGRVELAYLQLALERIWEAEGGRAATALRTSTLRDRLKGVREIARKHVEQVLGELPAADQVVCAAVFDRLVTPSGGKILYPASDLAKFAQVSEKRMDSILTRLANRDTRLVHGVDLPARGVRGFEILHDVLARPVLDWTTSFLTGREAAAARRQSNVVAIRAGLALVLIVGLGLVAAWGYGERRAGQIQKQESGLREQKIMQESALRLAKLAQDQEEKRRLAEFDAAVEKFNRQSREQQIKNDSDAQERRYRQLKDLMAARDLQAEVRETRLRDIGHLEARRLLEGVAERAKAKKFLEIEREAWKALGDIYVAKGPDDEAIKFFEVARSIKVERKNADWESSLLVSFGNAYDNLPDRAKALASYREAARIARENGLGDRERDALVRSLQGASNPTPEEQLQARERLRDLFKAEQDSSEREIPSSDPRRVRRVDNLVELHALYAKANLKEKMADVLQERYRIDSGFENLLSYCESLVESGKTDEISAINSKIDETRFAQYSGAALSRDVVLARRYAGRAWCTHAGGNVQDAGRRADQALEFIRRAASIPNLPSYRRVFSHFVTTLNALGRSNDAQYVVGRLPGTAPK